MWMGDIECGLKFGKTMGGGVGQMGVRWSGEVWAA